MSLTFEEAVAKLKTCNRAELRDHCFGDKEVYFTDKDGNGVAEGYSGPTGSEVGFIDGNGVFVGGEAAHLLKLGVLTQVERNDSQGDEEMVN